MAVKSIFRQHNLSTQAKTVNDNGTGEINTSGTRYISWSDQRSDPGAVPNYRLKIKRAVSATSELSGNKRKLLSYNGEVQAHFITASPKFRKYESGDLYRQNVVFLIQGGSADVSATDKAASKLLQHYIEATNTWRGGNFLAEVRETMHMLRHPVESLYRRTWEHAGNLKRLRRVYKQKPIDLKKAIADAWLGWRFGVNPLIQDCNDAGKAFRQLSDRRGFDLKPLRGFGRRTIVTDVITLSYGAPIQNFGFRTEEIQKRDYTVRYHGFMKCDPSNNQWQIAQCGISPDDLLPAVWEGTGFSWLVDYFVNVGEVLDSMRLWGIDLAWLNVTVRNSATQNLVGLGMLPDTPAVQYSGNPGRAYTLYTAFGRSPSGIPFPRFHFQMPGMMSLKWLNIAALLTQIKGA